MLYCLESPLGSVFSVCKIVVYNILQLCSLVWCDKSLEKHFQRYIIFHVKTENNFLSKMSVSYLIGGRDFSPCTTIAAPKTEGFTCQFHVSAQQHTVCVCGLTTKEVLSLRLIFLCGLFMISQMSTKHQEMKLRISFTQSVIETHITLPKRLGCSPLLFMTSIFPCHTTPNPRHR